MAPPNAAQIAWSDVTAIAKRLSPTDPQQVDLLEWVNGIALDVATFGGQASQRLRMARIYLAAHVATTTTLLGAGGIVTQDKAENLSRSYAAPLKGNLYVTTGYGRMFWSIARGTAARAGLVTGLITRAGGRGGVHGGGGGGFTR